MKHLLWIVALIAVFFACKSCEKGEDSGKILEYAQAKYARLFGDRPSVKAYVAKCHPYCFDQAYSMGSRRKRGSLDQDEYERLMFEKLKAKFGLPKPPAR